MMLHRLLRSREDAPIAAATIAVALFAVVLIAARGLPVEGRSFVGPFSLAAILFVVAFCYRTRSAKLAAGCGFAGWFILFTAAMAVANMLLLPIRFPSIDPFLYRLDTALGWSWEGMVAFGAAHPTLSFVLRTVYDSSLPQISLLVCALAFAGERRELFLLSGTLSLAAFATVGFWFVFPSFGPAAFVAIDPDLVRRAGLAVDPAYGADLVRLSIEGPSAVSLDHAKGLIAFPSFHTVMAAMCVWHARNVVWLKAILWPLNALMIPAILLHGGHHAVDVPAGLLVFALALWAVNRTAAHSSIGLTPRLA